MSTHSKLSPWLFARQLGYTLPNGRRLFANIELALQRRMSGLVGRNGIGKTALARLLAGVVMPTDGVIERQGAVAYVEQRIAPGAETVAEYLGCAPQLAALQRFNEGGCEPDDFELVADVWDLELRILRWLSSFGLDYLDLQMTTAQLSGGELVRLNLIAALLGEPDHLILDEPSNHLDHQARQQLGDFVQKWPGGVLLIGHDRELLEQMDDIYTLDSHGLHYYHGNYSAFLASREQQRESLLQQVTQGKVMLRREQRQQTVLKERQERRLSSGRRNRKEANQAKVLLDRQKERSDHGSARLASNQAARIQRCGATLQALEARLEVLTEIKLSLPPLQSKTGHSVVECESLYFGYERELFHGLTFQIMPGERVALSGGNGRGKSTLFRLLCGELTPREGQITLHCAWALLDQHLSLLDDEQTPLENLRRLSPGMDESAYRTRLARLRITAERVTTPVGMMSGGERLMCALASLLLGTHPVPLLLLDEPTNNLDLEAITALESALREYQGTLLVITHDRHLLDAIGITRVIDW